MKLPSQNPLKSLVPAKKAKYKDPIRHPKVSEPIENRFKKSFSDLKPVLLKSLADFLAAKFKSK